MAFDIEFSTRKAVKRVEALNQAVLNLGRSADGASAKLQGSIGGLGGTGQLKNIQASINSVNQSLIRMGNQWQKTQTAGARSAGAMNKRMATQSRTFKKAKVGADQYGDSMLTLSQKAAILRSGMLALGTHVGIFSATTLLAATITFGLVKAIKAVITVGGEFTRSLSETSAIIGVGKDQLKGLTEQMLELAETTKFTTTEVAKAATILAKTGLKATAVAQALPPVLNLAAIGSMEMSKAADIAANSMFGFQLKASDLSMVVDTLAFAATNSNTTVQQLGNALSFAAPVAQAAGAKFNEVAGMLAVMADAGVKASRAGTTLRRAYVNLLDPGEKATTVFNDLGVTLRDSVTGQMRSMVDIMQDFAIAGGNAIDITRIFGVRAAPGMIAVWKDMAKAIAGGDAKLADFLKRLRTDGVGSANKMREAMEDNLIDTWLKFTSVLSVKATRAFDLIEGKLVSMVEAMTEFARTSVDVSGIVDRMSIHFEQWGNLFERFPETIRLTSGMLSKLTKIVRDFGTVFGISMGIVKQSIVDLPINLISGFSMAVLKLGRFNAQMVLNVGLGLEKLKKFWTELKFALIVIMQDAALSLSKIFDDIVFGISKKIQDISDLVRKLPGGDNLASSLSRMSENLSEFELGSGAAKNLAETEGARKAAIAGIDSRIRAMRGLKDEVDNLHDAEMRLIALDNMALKSARDASLGKLALFKRERESAKRRQSEVDSHRDFDFSGAGEPSLGRPPLRDPIKEIGKDIMKENVKDLKQFIKLQKVSVDATQMQISRLVALKELSVFEALEGSMEAQKNSIGKIREEYLALLAPLERFKQFALDDGYKTKAREYQVQIDKLGVAYEVVTGNIEKSINKQENALIRLRDKYRIVTDAAGEYRIEVNRQRTLSESELLSGVDAIREAGTSPGEKAQRDFAERQRVLDEAHATEQTVFRNHKELLLLSEQEYQDRSMQLQIQSAAKQAQLWGGSNTEIFNLAESVRQNDLQGMMSHGIAALDQAGRTNKKAFELSKKAKIAQAVIATYTGAAEALQWGWPMGPIFAAMIAANGAIQIAAIQATTFGGGSGSVKKSSGSTSAPSATIPETPVPSQSDVLFNQTNTGGQRNTIDSGSSQDVTLNFEFSAVDARGIDSLIQRKAPQIVSIVQSAYTERGKTGGPIT